MKKLILSTLLLTTLTATAQKGIPAMPEPDCIGKDGSYVLQPVNSPEWTPGSNKLYNHYPCSDRPVNVGIGTNDPLFKLDVRGIIYSPKTKIGSRGATELATLNVFNPTSSTDIVNFGVRTSQTNQ